MQLKWATTFLHDVYLCSYASMQLFVTMGTSG